MDRREIAKVPIRYYGLSDKKACTELFEEQNLTSSLTWYCFIISSKVYPFYVPKRNYCFGGEENSWKKKKKKP
jgi:hypothetical protein